MAWLPVEQSLLKHRKTLRATAALGTDRHKFIGHMVDFWQWAMDNVPASGSLGDLSDAEIAEAAGWPSRQAHRFVNVLELVGFLDADGTGRLIHDWPEHGGRLQERRATERQRQRDKRNVAPTLAQQTNDVGATLNAEKSREEESREDGALKRTTPSGGRADARTPRKVRAQGAPRETPKATAVVSLVKAAGVDVVLTARDGSAIKACSASPERIAEAFLAAARGQWGDEWLRNNLSVHLVIDRLAGYDATMRHQHNGKVGLTTFAHMESA